MTRELIETIRELSPIEIVVSEFTKLRRSGIQLIARCPLHSEKTASFYAHPSKGTFFCHGCQAGGDVFGFVMLVSGMTFPQAVQSLAERSGVHVQGFTATREIAAKVEAARRKRAEEIAFEKFFNDRVDVIAQHCRSLGRAATWAERFLTSGIADAALEDLARCVIADYHSYHLRVEREELADPDNLRAEWVRRGKTHVAER